MPRTEKKNARTLPKQRVRVWLRLLRLSRRVEAILRERLRSEFGTTLPRFDVMAALYEHQQGLKMSEVSSVLKVSNGNITGIVDRLVEDGCIIRVAVAGDRRAWKVLLTKKGREQFAVMAEAHEGWISELFDELDQRDSELMIEKLDWLHHAIGDEE